MADTPTARSALAVASSSASFWPRARAQEAELYFMDEPFVGVDATTEGAIVDLLRELRARGKTVVCVHHDLESAPDYFDWLVLLNVRVIADGPFAATSLPRTWPGPTAVARTAHPAHRGRRAHPGE